MIWILLAVTLIPLAAGTVAVLLAGHGARPQTGLVFHSVRRVRRADFSYVMGNTLESVLTRMNGEGIIAQTVSAFAARSPAAAPHTGLLTFDDGLADSYEYALPLLERFGAKATFFPIAGAIGSRANNDVFGPQHHASAEQLREIAVRGHEIGSHTLSHADLTLLDMRELERELGESKKMLEDIVGREVVSLSFPYGSWNERVWRTARELGYRWGTAYRGSRRTLPGLIPVLGVYSFDTVDDILLKLKGGTGLSAAMARSRIMPQFARGTALWRYRPTYHAGRLVRS